MKIHFDDAQNYDCLQCGRGCRAGWDIAVEPEVAQSLGQHPLTLRVIQERGKAFRHLEDRVYIENSREFPVCGFLDENQLCAIHRDLGYQAKPATCKLFPFVATHTPDGYYAGVTYYCTAVRQNHGRPSSAHEQDLRQQLAHSAPVNRVAEDGLVVYNRYFVSYRDYLALEEELLRRAARSGSPEALGEAVLGLACLMAEQKDLEEEIVSLGSRLGEMWTHPARPPGPTGGRLGSLVNAQMGDYFMFTLEKELWPQVDEALAKGSAFSLPQYGWRGTFADLNRLVDNRFDARIEAYLRHLVWRKALVVHPPLLASLCQLQALPAFLRAISGLLAHQRGREVTEQDYFDALEHVETYLVTHGKNRRVVHEWAVDVLIRTLRS